MELKERLQTIAEEHAAAKAKVEAVLPVAELTARAEDRAAQHFSTLLDQGHEAEHAMAAAVDEAARHAQYLARVASMFALGAPRMTVLCEPCGKETEHVTEVDRNSETIAYCLCGSFKKFPKAE